MSLLVFQHDGDEDAAVLGRILQEHGHTLRTVELFARQSIPPDLDDVDGVISMGGPMDLDHTTAYPWYGVCLGAKLRESIYSFISGG